MRPLPFNLVFILFCSFIWIGCNNKSYHDSTVVEATYPFTSSETLNIQNKYGQIRFREWTKDSVYLKITVEVKSKDRKTLNSALNNFPIKTQHYDKTLFITREDYIAGNTPHWWEFWKNNQYSYQLTYEIYIPSDIHLEIEQEYGDVDLFPFTGNFSLNLKQGKFSGQLLEGKSDIRLEHAEAIIDKMENGKIATAYSEVKINQAGDLTLESKNSEISIEEAGDLNIYSKYDEYALGRVGNLVNIGAYDEIGIRFARGIAIENSHAEIEVSVVDLQFDIDLWNSDLQILNTGPEFSLAKISGGYLDIFLQFNDPFAYDLEGLMLEVNIDPGIESALENDGNFQHYKGKMEVPSTINFSGKLEYSTLDIDYIPR